MARDIFAIAQAMQANKNLGNKVQISAPPIFNSNASDQQNIQQNPQGQTSQKFQDILAKPTGPAQSSQDIMNYLSDLGVDGSNIPMTDTGRQLLINRLKGKYGDEYKNIPQAKNAISMFDAHLARYNDVAAQDEAAIQDKANTTLAFLRGSADVSV